MQKSEINWLHVGDFLGRAGIVGYFAYAASEKLSVIIGMLLYWNEQTSSHKELWLLSQMAVMLFLLLVVVTTLFRLKPVKSADGLEPRITALAGTFLLGLLALTPPAAPLPAALTAFALVLIIVGFGLSCYVLHWLGRSFSIMAEARKLVTGGPYGIVRHPLYLTEEIAIVGVILLNLSLEALIIGAVHWGLQLRRMHNEERVLSAAFPDYADYSRTTPRVIPYLAPRGETA